MVRLSKMKLDKLLIGFTIFLNGLGFVLEVAGINIVFFFALASIGVLVFNLVASTAKVRKLFDHRKFFIWTLFVFWITYAFVQGLYITDMNLYYMGLRQLITNFLVVIFVLYLFDFNSYNDFDVLYKAVFMVLLINTVFGLIEIIFGFHFVEAPSIWAADHVRGLSENENEYATTMYCSIVIMLFLQFFKKTGGIVIKGLIALGALCIFMSSSRGVSLAIIVFSVLFFFSYFCFKYLRWGGAALKFAILVLCTLAMLLIVSGTMNDFVVYLIIRFSGSGNEMSDFYRWQLIQEAVNCFIRTMGFGVGPGQSIYYLRMNVHNFFFEILAEYGFIIFMTMVSIFIYIWIGAFNSRIGAELRAMYFAIIPSLLIASVTSSSIFKFKLFWIGIVLLYLLRKSNFGNQNLLEDNSCIS